MPTQTRHQGRADGHLRASDLFVGREGPVALFTRTVRAIGDGTRQVLAFHGADGLGKTQLCRHLADLLAEGRIATGLRWALVDLRDRDQRPAPLPLLVRNALRRTGRVRFPAFDHGFTLFWKDAHPGQPVPIDHPWQDESPRAIPALVANAEPLAVDRLPLIGPALGGLARRAARIGKATTLRRTADALRQVFERGAVLAPRAIQARLPALLARDLDAWREDHPDDRFLVLVNEDPARPGLEAVRDLAAQCRSTLFVVFARDALRWEADDPDWMPALNGRQHALAGLSRTDAERYLTRAGAGPAPLRAAMIEGATPQDAEFACPIMLDLQLALFDTLCRAGTLPGADAFRLDGTPTERQRELLARLLRGYGPRLAATLRHLAVARRFDPALFEHLATTFATGLAGADWPALAALPLVLPTRQEGSFTFHPALREAIAATLEPATALATHAALFRWFAAGSRAPEVTGPTAAHALAAAEAFHHAREADPELALRWWGEAGEAFHHAGFDDLVEAVDRDCIGMAARVFGETSTWHAVRLSWYADDLEGRGHYVEAETLHRRDLAITEALRGPDHPDTAASLTGLAANLDAQRRHADAEPLHRRALAIREAALSPDHPDTATALTSLGWSLGADHRHADAEPLHRRALAIREAALGPRHPETALSLAALAANLDAQGRHPEAEAFHRSDVRISEAARGPDHADTAAGLDRLAANLDAQGRPAEAEKLHRRVLKLRESALGPQHRLTAASLDGLGVNLDAQGQRQEAEKLLRRALAIREAVLGPAHRDTATSLSNLGTNLDDQGRHATAEALHRRALEIYEEVLGAHHRDTATALSNLGDSLDDRGRHVAAEPLHRRALAIWSAVLPAAHWHAAVGRSRLGACLDGLIRHDEAGPLHRLALAVLQAALGQGHARTARAGFLFARHCYAVGEKELACGMAMHAHATLMACYGSAHWRTRRVAAWLAAHGGPDQPRAAVSRPLQPAPQRPDQQQPEHRRQAQ